MHKKGRSNMNHEGQWDAVREDETSLYGEQAVDEWIKSLSHEQTPRSPIESVSASHADAVMQRIYAGEPWKAPMALRNHTWSHPRRLQIGRQFGFLMVTCVLLLGYVLYVSTANTPLHDNTYGLMPVHALGDVDRHSFAVTSAEVPVASIAEPLILHQALVEPPPSHGVVLAVFTFVMVLLLCSWLARLRA